MPVNWDDLKVEDNIRVAGNKTDARLSKQISSVTRMTEEEVIEMFPEASDIEKLQELMAIVKSSEDRNTKIVRIEENSKKFAGVVLSLLDKFV